MILTNMNKEEIIKQLESLYETNNVINEHINVIKHKLEIYQCELVKYNERRNKNIKLIEFYEKQIKTTSNN